MSFAACATNVGRCPGLGIGHTARMRLALATAVAAAAGLVGTSSAAPALPPTGLLVEGRALGGIQLGWTRARVVAAWGRGYGRCRSCARETLYFTGMPFEPEGAGVELRQGRVTAVFTLWSPAGWRTSRGVRIGEPSLRVEATYPTLPAQDCGTYRAIELEGSGSRSAVIVVEKMVWGFILVAAGEPLCR